MRHSDFDAEETICAIATPIGRGGIGVVRISGTQSLNIIKKFCSFLPDKPESHKIYYGFFTSIDGKNSVDEVLVSYFAKSKSYTGEESLEISCHGNPLVLEEVVGNLCQGGARIANRGEFTFRAFMNGRIDLMQAESVLSLIESRSVVAQKNALRQLQGKLSQDISQIEDELIQCLAHIEAGIDFSTEGIDLLKDEDIQLKLSELNKKIDSIISYRKHSSTLTNGLKVAIVGEPNTGKSSLFNVLLGKNRALVHSKAGTTRDLVDAHVTWEGYLIHLFDTAGIRVSQDEVENEGIKLSLKTLEDADIFICLISDFCELKNSSFFEKLENKEGIFALAKSDIHSQKYSNVQKQLNKTLFKISAKTGQGLLEIKSFILSRIKSISPEEGLALVKERQISKMLEIKEYVHSAIEKLEKKESLEFLASDLKSSVLATQELLGKKFDDQILDRVFQEFCIGK